jgi:myo-inositol-1(or 4)-monophosphatase
VTWLPIWRSPLDGSRWSVAAAWSPLGRDPLRVSAITRIEQALGGLSFNPSPETKRRVGEIITVLLPAIGDVRRVPAALGLVYVAAGRFDAVLMVDTQSWDVAAGLFVAAEAGAVVVELSHAGVGLIVTTPPALVPDLVRLLPPAA